MKKKKLFAAAFILILCKNGTAQQSTFTATFTDEANKVKPVTVSFAKPMFAYENSHGYWFINPANKYKHFQTGPDAGFADRKEEAKGIAYITLNQTEADVDFYSQNDSVSVSLQQAKNVISAPAYDPKKGEANKPLHVHINSISASEISFTLSGAAVLSSTEGYAGVIANGTINGTGHFYRDGKYATSDVLPGCNCDPIIYATVFNPDNNVRTQSACEAAFRNKLFDAVQKAMSPLFSTVAYNGNGALSPGEISIAMLPGSANINVPVNERPWCSSDYYHNGLTGVNAHKNNFTNNDGFGLRFIKMPGNEMQNQSSQMDMINHMKTFMDSMTKLVSEKKITSEQYTKALQNFSAKANATTNNGPDIKKMEVDHNLYLSIIINASNNTDAYLKLADKSETVVQHNIKGSAFEIYSPMIKEADGSWLPNRMGIYLGKFSAPAAGKIGAGWDAEATTPVYPVNGNKLTVYNVILKMEGGKELMDKAIANIDFTALQELITR